MSKTTNGFSPEVRERVVRLVFDKEARHPSRWQAVMLIAAKIGCTLQTLNDWVKKAEVDIGRRPGFPTERSELRKALERENRELRQTDEILKASASAMTTLWPRRSTTCSRRRSSIVAVRGAASKLSNTQLEPIGNIPPAEADFYAPL
jgi:transposase-like protein